jgi:hypothetical protein
MAEEKNLLRSLTVLPLPVPECNTRAMLVVPGFKNEIEVPTEGVKVIFEEPIDVSNQRINARLWCFDRQTEKCFFTVSGPSAKPDADGHINLSVVCYGPSICFGMFQSDADGESPNT